MASQAPKTFDVIVIGAGAAGLAAADVLVRAGRSVLIMEARERVGGRAWTRRMPGLDIPVELGAEFIHGEAKETHALLHRAAISAVESTRVQRYLDHGRLRPLNAFDAAQRAFAHVGDIEPDISFDRFLARQRLSKKTKTFARMMVQGFDAADPARVSARSIAEEWGEGGSLGASQPRPHGGYGALFAWLANSLVQSGARLQLGCAVRELRWKNGEVSVRSEFLGKPFSARAACAIVTLSLGVLQSNTVRFIPGLRKQAVLKKLASGPIVRVAMRFHTRFWQARSPGVAFYHVPQAPFPTFWTPLPMRGPLLTAWAGGPKAARLTGSPKPRLVAEALRSVRSVFGDAVRAELACAYVHDWHADPWSRGGYSYVLVGGTGAREALAQPLEKTLYFAGEATDKQEAGTVAGALRSGERAAAEVLAR